MDIDDFYFLIHLGVLGWPITVQNFYDVLDARNTVSKWEEGYYALERRYERA